MPLAAFSLWMILESKFQKNCNVYFLVINLYSEEIFTFLVLTHFLFSVEVESL